MTDAALVGIDLLARTRTLLLDGEPRGRWAEEVALRLLHVAARIVRTYLCIGQRWRWARLAAAYARLDALPAAVG